MSDLTMHEDEVNESGEVIERYNALTNEFRKYEVKS